jgi:hypothetical protein
MPVFGSAARLAASLAVAALLCGCGEKATVSAEVARQTADWVTAKTKDGALTLKVPKGWVQVDPTNPEYVKRRQAIVEANPRVQGTLDAGAMLLLMAVSTDPKAISAASVDNVGVARIPGKWGSSPSDKDVADFKAGLESSMPGAGQITVERVELPAGSGLRYYGSISLSVPGGESVSMHIVGYAVPGKDGLYAVCYTSSAERAAQIDEMAATSVQTLVLR